MNQLFKKTVILFALLGYCWITKAQVNSDYLEPARGTFEVSDSSLEYYSIVRKLLFDGLSDNPEIRFLEMPSFTPESVLDIEFDRAKSEYFMSYRISEQNIWYAPNRKEVKVEKFRIEIEKKSVELLKTLFYIATSQVKYPPPIINEDGSLTVARSFDGTSYYFTTNQYYKIRTGMTHSPSKGSKMHKLVNVGYKLVELAKSDKGFVGFDDAFQREIKELIKELTINQ